MLRLFGDERLGGFYDPGGDRGRLIVRPRNLFDKAVPCGSSVAIETLLRLAILTGESSYETAALKALRPMADLMARHASGFGRFLCALDFHLGPIAEVALRSEEHTSELQSQSNLVCRLLLEKKKHHDAQRRASELCPGTDVLMRRR